MPMSAMKARFINKEGRDDFRKKYKTQYHDEKIQRKVIIIINAQATQVLYSFIN